MNVSELWEMRSSGDFRALLIYPHQSEVFYTEYIDNRAVYGDYWKLESFIADLKNDDVEWLEWLYQDWQVIELL